MNPKFLDLMNVLFAMQNTVNGMEIKVHDGYITIDAYVGIENTTLLKQGQEMFSDA
jgi:hypothetical protein